AKFPFASSFLGDRAGAAFPDLDRVLEDYRLAGEFLEPAMLRIALPIHRDRRGGRKAADSANAGRTSRGCSRTVLQGGQRGINSPRLPLAPSRSCSGSSTPVLQFHRYQAGNGDSEKELADDRLQIGQAAGQWIDGNDVAVTRRGQRGEAEI